LGIGDWGLGIGPNPQSPIPNPHISIRMRSNTLYAQSHNNNHKLLTQYKLI